jgi:hypothetical protein
MWRYALQSFFRIKLRSKQLESPLYTRMRTVWHATTLSAAESIVESQMIHTKDLDGASNFHPNQSSSNVLDEYPEVTLEFYWNGDIEFRSFDDGSLISDDKLTVYVTNGIDNLDIDTIAIWASKLKGVTQNKLSVCGIAVFSEFNERLGKDTSLQSRYETLKEKCTNKKYIKVA